MHASDMQAPYASLNCSSNVLQVTFRLLFLALLFMACSKSWKLHVWVEVGDWAQVWAATNRDPLPNSQDVAWTKSKQIYPRSSMQSINSVCGRSTKTFLF